LSKPALALFHLFVFRSRQHFILSIATFNFRCKYLTGSLKVNSMSSPVSPNENGQLQVRSHLLRSYFTGLTKMQPDIHYVLKQDPKDAFAAIVDGQMYHSINPVTCERCDYDSWRASPHKSPRITVQDVLHLLKWWRSKLLGRRCNDEIELFEIAAGEASCYPPAPGKSCSELTSDRSMLSSGKISKHRASKCERMSSQPPRPSSQSSRRR
jgi:hypothetical protein